MLEMMMLLLLGQEEGPFFHRSDVDFWGTRKKIAAPAASLWTEPILGPDGRWQVYAPPREVVEFLEAPNRESGERYLAWQRERLDRLRTAMRVLGDLQAEEREPVLYYFARAGCPYCADQDRVLAIARLPGFRVVKVEPESPLWARYGIRVVPTIVMQRPGRSPYRIEGFVPRAVLEEEVRRVDR